MIKILSWNCYLPPWSITRKQRVPKIVSAMLKISPEIICLQEVFFRKDAVKIVKLLQTKGYLDYFYFKDLLIVSKIKLVYKKGKIFKKQGNYLSLAALDASYRKSFQSVQFSIKNQSYSLINLHALSAWALPFSHLQKTREEQVKEVCEFLKQQPKKRKIILGDFNFQPNTLPYKFLIKSKFTDTATEAGNTLKNRRLDFIFLKNIPKYKTQITLSDKSFSDHSALITVIN